MGERTVEDMLRVVSGCGVDGKSDERIGGRDRWYFAGVLTGRLFLGYVLMDRLGIGVPLGCCFEEYSV